MATRSKASKDPHKDFADAIKLLHKGDYKKAQSSFEELAEKSDDPQVAARSQSYLKVCERALAPAKGPQDEAENAYQSGVFAHNQEDWEEARKRYKAALKKVKGKESAEILVALAATEAKAGKNTDSLSYLKKALKADPSVRFLATGDPDFERLKQQDAFKKLIESAEEA